MTKTQKVKLAIIEDFLNTNVSDEKERLKMINTAHMYITKILKDEQYITQNNGRVINIPFTFEELQRLLDGETFDWTFNGIDIHLFNEEISANTSY